MYRNHGNLNDKLAFLILYHVLTIISETLNQLHMS
jgi:hypothetical protein